MYDQRAFKPNSTFRYPKKIEGIIDSRRGEQNQTENSPGRDVLRIVLVIVQTELFMPILSFGGR
jgi:hypothetical protein